MHGNLPTVLLLDAYRGGIFPMADSGDDENYAFYRPELRALIPIETPHIPASLLKTIRREKFGVSINRDFPAVIDGCAAMTPKRAETWINKPIRDLFILLHEEGHAHSIECWDRGGSLVGGLYGLAIGAVFCGESMFSVERDASKVALVALCALLWKSGFTVLDAQFMNPHLLQFGAYEIPQLEYEMMIRTEMEKDISLIQDNPGDVLKDYMAFRNL